MLISKKHAYGRPTTSTIFQSQTILDELLTRRNRSFLSQQIIFSYQILIDILYKVWGSNTEDYGRAIQIATGRRGDLGRSAQLFEGIFIDEPIESEKLEESLKLVSIVERIPGDQKRPSPNFGRSNSLISSINFFAEKKTSSLSLIALVFPSKSSWASPAACGKSGPAPSSCVRPEMMMSILTFRISP